MYTNHFALQSESYTHSTLYPMPGAGIFFVAIRSGFVLAYEAGLPCIALPRTGLLTGVGGVRFVVGLDRFGRGDCRRPAARSERPRTVPVTTPPIMAPILGPRRTRSVASHPFAAANAASPASLRPRPANRRELPAGSGSEVQRDVAVHGPAFRDQARLSVREPLLDAQADVVPDRFLVDREPRQ